MSLIDFNYSFVLFEELDNYIKKKLEFYSKDFDKNDLMKILSYCYPPRINTHETATYVIASFLRASEENHDVMEFTEKIISNGLTIKNIVMKANKLYEAAYDYHLSRNLKYYKDLIKGNEIGECNVD